MPRFVRHVELIESSPPAAKPVSILSITRYPGGSVGKCGVLIGLREPAPLRGGCSYKIGVK
ncbi:hypothetical protein P5673_004112 [Acropora cervicornis]|uniref:Uncharacterized protein n=1 Tax=Acropora cervicornis TaxID=6130 RepID=A0AAD9R2A2_ACRCE|nr:hypothetical protein P5673_004112 [Acropora cervicornis]